MENVLNVVANIKDRYFAEYKAPIDEMKLNKLMYFAQRESFIQFDQPLFDADFYGWKYGPILKEIRSAYENGTIDDLKPNAFNGDQSVVMDRIFKDYAVKSSWSLSRLTHGELSWRNSRNGIPDHANSDNIMCLEDIRQDAMRIKERRFMLGQLGLLK